MNPTPTKNLSVEVAALATRFSQTNAEKQSLPHLSCHELLTESDGDPKLATGIPTLASECVSGVRLELLHTSSEIYRHTSCHSNSHQADEPGTTDWQSVAFRGKPKKGSLSEPSHSCSSINDCSCFILFHIHITRHMF